VDFDDVAPSGETFRGEVEAVDAERQILKNKVAVGWNLEAALEAVAFAEEFAAGGESGAFWIVHFEMKFAAETLGARRGPRGETEEASQQVEARDTDWGPSSVHCKNNVIPGVSIDRARARAFPR